MFSYGGSKDPFDANFFIYESAKGINGITSSSGEKRRIICL
jgi:hypothetical protein